MRFSVKTLDYNDDYHLSFYVDVNNINPLEIEEDMKIVKQFFADKYRRKTVKSTFLSYICNLVNRKKDE